MEIYGRISLFLQKNIYAIILKIGVDIIYDKGWKFKVRKKRYPNE